MSTNKVHVPELSGSVASRALWERAYQDLRDKDKEVLGKHEEELSKATKIMVDEKLREDAINEWTLNIAGKSLKLRELGLNIIGFIDSSQDYVQSATSLEPHAALAWSCVSLLLPVSQNLFILLLDYMITYPNQWLQLDKVLEGLLTFAR
jgi:hypothetical protein